MSDAIAKHWPDCAMNHGGTACDMGPECGTEGAPPDVNREWKPLPVLVKVLYGPMDPQVVARIREEFDKSIKGAVSRWLPVIVEEK